MNNHFKTKEKKGWPVMAELNVRSMISPEEYYNLVIMRMLQISKDYPFDRIVCVNDCTYYSKGKIHIELDLKHKLDNNYYLLYEDNVIGSFHFYYNTDVVDEFSVHLTRGLILKYLSHVFNLLKIANESDFKSVEINHYSICITNTLYLKLRDFQLPIVLSIVLDSGKAFQWWN